MWLILYIVWGVVIVSSQVFISDRLRVDPDWSLSNYSYHGMLIQKINRDIISIAVVPAKQKWSVQHKLKHNNVRLIR